MIRDSNQLIATALNNRKGIVNLGLLSGCSLTYFSICSRVNPFGYRPRPGVKRVIPTTAWFSSNRSYLLPLIISILRICCPCTLLSVASVRYKRETFRVTLTPVDVLKIAASLDQFLDKLTFLRRQPCLVKRHLYGAKLGQAFWRCPEPRNKRKCACPQPTWIVFVQIRPGSGRSEAGRQNAPSIE